MSLSVCFWDITEPHDCQMTTDNKLIITLYLLASVPKYRTSIKMFYSCTFSLGKAGLDSRHQTSVDCDTNTLDYLDSFIDPNPEPDQLHNLAPGGDVLFVSGSLTVEVVAKTDVPSWGVIVHISRQLLGAAKTHRCEDGRGRPVTLPRENDNKGTGFHLVTRLPGSGRAGIHGELILNRDQKWNTGRQQQSAQTAAPIWRFARR